MNGLYLLVSRGILFILREPVPFSPSMKPLPIHSGFSSEYLLYSPPIPLILQFEDLI